MDIIYGFTLSLFSENQRRGSYLVGGHAYTISTPTTPILSRRAINHDLLSEA